MGLLMLGKQFAFTTILSTVVSPLILGIFEHIPVLHHLTDDVFLCAILSGLLMGLEWVSL